MEKGFETICIKTGRTAGDLSPLLEDAGHVYMVYDKAVETFVSGLRVRSSLGLKGGEGAKSLAVVEEISRFLMDGGADRDAILLIVGGGSVSDVCAFTACVYKRGIRFATAPTTLLAQVDAAIGGKNAVNLGGTKNVLGLIRQPEFTYLCPEPLFTLPAEELRSGAAELVKTFILKGEGYGEVTGLLATCRGNDSPSRRRLIRELQPAVAEAARFKASVVEKDPFDMSERRSLNLGHTFGHAIEARFGLSHGDSVAIGIIMAARLSERIGLAEEGLCDRLKTDFSAMGLPVDCPGPLSFMTDKMKQDKKASGNRLQFILPVRIGEVTEKYLTAEEAVSILEI